MTIAILYLYPNSGLDQEGLFTGGGGGTSSQRLVPSGASRDRGESMRGSGTPRSLEGGHGELPRFFFKS